MTAGWLSLLAATCLIDLHADHAAEAHLRTAGQLAAETGHPELTAWMLETRAWQALTAGDRPEHHYRYDPPKSHAYVATTLAWVGDRAAEGVSREVLAEIDAPGYGPPRPRRAALARLDLALALAAAGKDDQAAATALHAVRSGRLAPVDGRRVQDILRAVTASQAPGAAEAYRDGGSPR